MSIHREEENIQRVYTEEYTESIHREEESIHREKNIQRVYTEKKRRNSKLDKDS